MSTETSNKTTGPIGRNLNPRASVRAMHEAMIANGRAFARDPNAVLPSITAGAPMPDPNRSAGTGGVALGDRPRPSSPAGGPSEA